MRGSNGATVFFLVCYILLGLLFGRIEIVLILTALLIYFLYVIDKDKKIEEEQENSKQKAIEYEKEINQLKKQAKETINNKYKNSNLSEKELEDLIRQEFINLMIERKWIEKCLLQLYILYLCVE